MKSSSAWVFGLATTILFLSLWGRAVVVDAQALGDAVAPMSRSVTMVDRLSGWLEEELVDVGVDPTTANLVVAQVRDTPSVSSAIERFLFDAVAAAASPGASSVDVAGILQPTVPEIVATLDRVGVPVPPDRVEQAVASLDPIMIVESGSPPLVGPESPIASRLSTAAVLAIAVMGMSGGALVWAGPNRARTVRRLAGRVAQGGLSFGIFLRLGSWVLDPGGGRAPVGAALSQLAGAKWFVPVTLGVVAAALAGMLGMARGRIRPKEALPLPSADSTPLKELEPSR